jgi:hypothetical protein
MLQDNMAADIGTILVGHEAVDIGLINEVGGLNKAIGKLKSLISETSPIQKQQFKM